MKAFIFPIISIFITYNNAEFRVGATFVVETLSQLKIM